MWNSKSTLIDKENKNENVVAKDIEKVEKDTNPIIK